MFNPIIAVRSLLGRWYWNRLYAKVLANSRAEGHTLTERSISISDNGPGFTGEYRLGVDGYLFKFS